MKSLQPPTNVTELRRILGMLNYLGRYVPDLSQVCQPMNQLLRAETVWYWGSEQDHTFQQMKTFITESPVLVYFDPNKPPWLVLMQVAMDLEQCCCKTN